ncbi:hypothetical protein GIB67_011103 [Kingdonia uniflora]|uniref:Regulator of Vps4 activity in the MVB pathway protein n=1 Tax=Kingdonia uniflora TaxID=39325 RepID=A0A7J7PAZ3_9MAGN|nr:hypothetical protein GIB67_011103 [Kingdonia uniflora]
MIFDMAPKNRAMSIKANCIVSSVVRLISFGCLFVASYFLRWSSDDIHNNVHVGKVVAVKSVVEAIDSKLMAVGCKHVMVVICPQVRIEVCLSFNNEAMLDGLLGRGFSSKCKASIKLTKTRIDVIRRKRNSMQKFLKKDIADLLSNGLEINAYGRAEGLIIELNLSSCYDSVEQFCGCIPRHLSVMQKQRECPEECKEAVSSLMFAAARFADLPELRDLRQIFTDRYGNSLDAFRNQEFVERLASKPPTKDNKLQLMREIAREFSIKWDSKAFEQSLSNPPAPVQNQPQRRRSFHDPSIEDNKPFKARDDTVSERNTLRGRVEVTDTGRMLHNGSNSIAVERDNKEISYRGRELANGGYNLRADGENGSSAGRQELADDGCNLKGNNQEVSSHRRRELTDNGYKAHNCVDETVRKRSNQEVSSRNRGEVTDNGYNLKENQDVPSRGRHGLNDNEYRPSNGKDEVAIKKENQDTAYRERREFINDSVLNRDSIDNSTHERRKYVGDVRLEYASGYTEKQEITEEAKTAKPLYNKWIPPPYVKPNVGKFENGSASVDSPTLSQDITDDHWGMNQAGTTRVNGHEGVNGIDRQDDLVGDTKPKPRSVRRKYLKPPPGHHDYHSGNTEFDDETARRNHPSGRRREDARRMGLQHALEDECDQKDEEEKMMDKLLRHYSKKPAKFEPIKVKEGLNAHSESVPSPARALSLPREPVTPTGSARVPTRATSFQPEMLNAGGHVHPKLPDYDDLAARFAALRGR